MLIVKHWICVCMLFLKYVYMICTDVYIDHMCTQLQIHVHVLLLFVFFISFVYFI